MDSRLSKETLRQEAIRHRDRIDPASEDAENAYDLFFEHIQPEPEHVISFYWPKEREFDPSGIMEKLATAGNICTLPVMQKDSRILKFARYLDEDALEKGPFGVMQPKCDDMTEWYEPDILIVPLLAFDRKGTRLGYGSGYYDATLEDLRKKKSVLAVGLGYAKQAVLFHLPAEDHDQPMDWIITPQDAFRFARKD